MNIVLLFALVVGIPLVTAVILGALVYSRKGNHPATYRMSEQWTYGPILWTATDEVVAANGHSTHHNQPHHNQSGDNSVTAQFSAGGHTRGTW